MPWWSCTGTREQKPADGHAPYHPKRSGVNDLTGHIVPAGGIVWNEITNRPSALAGLPIGQVTQPELRTGEIFRAEVNGREWEYWPGWKMPSARYLQRM